MLDLNFIKAAKLKLDTFQKTDDWANGIREDGVYSSHNVNRDIIFVTRWINTCKTPEMDSSYHFQQI